MKHLVTRRRFVTTTSITAAALVSGPLTPAAQALPIYETCKMKLGFMTSLAQDKTLPELVALARQYGYQGVESRPEWKQKHGIELSATAQQRRAVKRLFADHGVEISSVSPGVKHDHPVRLGKSGNVFVKELRRAYKPGYQNDWFARAVVLEIDNRIITGSKIVFSFFSHL